MTSHVFHLLEKKKPKIFLSCFSHYFYKVHLFFSLLIIFMGLFSVLFLLSLFSLSEPVQSSLIGKQRKLPET